MQLLLQSCNLLQKQQQNLNNKKMSQVVYDERLLTPLKQNQEQYQPDQQQIQGYAKFVLGLDLVNDRELMYLAEQALKAPLPQDWQACEYRVQQENEEQNEIVYRNKLTKVISAQHPLDKFYRQKAMQLKMIRQIYHADPIQEDMMESSINFKKMENSSLKKSSKVTVQNRLKLSKLKNESDKNKNNSSMNQSKSIQISQNNSSKSRLIENCFDDLNRNITQQSVLYDDELDNFSMITQRQQQTQRSGKVKNNIKKVILSPNKKNTKIKRQNSQNQIEVKKKQLLNEHHRFVKKIKNKLQKYNPQQKYNLLINSQLKKYENVEGFSFEQNETIKDLFQKLNKIKTENKEMDVKIQEMVKLAEIKQAFS